MSLQFFQHLFDLAAISLLFTITCIFSSYIDGSYHQIIVTCLLLTQVTGAVSCLDYLLLILD
jgi:hypothetical protein